jgi:hypothetical protein
MFILSFARTHTYKQDITENGMYKNKSTQCFCVLLSACARLLRRGGFRMNFYSFVHVKKRSTRARLGATSPGSEGERELYFWMPSVCTYVLIQFIVTSFINVCIFCWCRLCRLHTITPQPLGGMLSNNSQCRPIMDGIDQLEVISISARIGNK